MSTETTDRKRDTPPGTAALIAGISLLAMAVIAGYANFAVIMNIEVPGDPSATAKNLVEMAGPVRLAAAGFTIVVMLDVIVAWGLYVVLRSVNSGLSLLGGWLRLAYAAVLAVAINGLLIALRAGSIDPVLSVLFIEGFDSLWQIGLIIFGVHLCVVGYLVWQAAFIHRLFGLLLIIAGLGYIVDGFGTVLVPGYSLDLAVYTFIGEIAFFFWLLIRGRKLPDIPE